MTTLDKMLQGLANALGASLSTLTTTAKTVVGAINELKSGLTAVTDKASVIGSGSLDTTSQTLIGAVNELNGRTATYGTQSGTVSPGSSSDTVYKDLTTTLTAGTYVVWVYAYMSENSGYGSAWDQSYVQSITIDNTPITFNNDSNCPKLKMGTVIISSSSSITVTSRFYCNQARAVASCNHTIRYIKVS